MIPNHLPGWQARTVRRRLAPLPPRSREELARIRTLRARCYVCNAGPVGLQTVADFWRGHEHQPLRPYGARFEGPIFPFPKDHNTRDHVLAWIVVVLSFGFVTAAGVYTGALDQALGR